MELFIPIMKAHGVTCSVQEFHDAVNKTYHRHEANIYDKRHRAMWKSLPRVFDRLGHAADCVLHAGSSLRLIDIGCGTGLSSSLLLQTPLGRRISSITLVDTAPEMIAKAKAALRTFAGEVSTHAGTIAALNAPKFDIALTCSVLHHIPDLGAFLAQVSNVVHGSGVFIHLQDPNGDYLSDPALAARRHLLSQVRTSQRDPLIRRIIRRMQTFSRHELFVAKVNRELQENGVIQKPIKIEDLWKITDVHVENGAGISLGIVAKGLKHFRLVEACSYSFFGDMWSDLPECLQDEEVSLFESGLMDGQQLGAAWVNSCSSITE